MAKNKLSDLNDHLFAALERLNEDGLTTEQIESESKRVGAVIGVSNQIISNAKVTLEALKLISSGSFRPTELPESFGIEVPKSLKP